MPLRKNNNRTFHRCLYAGQMERIRLHKRDDDQREGVVRAVTVFNCRRGDIAKTGEPIAGDESVSYTTTWYLPQFELLRAGVHYINALDIIEQVKGDEAGRYWQPEADTPIDVKLFGDMITVSCKLTQPPNYREGAG